MEVARAAIERLENSGVDGSDIQLVSSDVDAARRPPDPKAEDRRVGRYVLPRVAFGALVGGGVGAILGVAVAIVVSGATDLVISLGLVAAFGLAGVLVGSAVGAFIGLERRVGFTESWTQTFDDETGGPRWVAVRARDASVFARARTALQTVGPLELRSNRPPGEQN